MGYSFLERRISGGVAADDKFWMGLEEGEFRLSRCQDCRRWMWPTHHRCADCGSWDQEWVPLAPVGTIYSWTRTWYGFEGVAERQDQLPYVTALVEIPAAGNARVLGILTGNTSDVAIGMPVVGTIHPPSPVTKGYASLTWSRIDAQVPGRSEGSDMTGTG